MTLIGFWKGSSTTLLDFTEPGSAVNKSVHQDFMTYLHSYNKIASTLCAFEAVKMSIWGMPIMNVSTVLLIEA